MLLIAVSNLGIMLDDSDDIESMLTSARDDDFCEDNYSTEAACNADSQCEWDAEDDPSDDDYPGECEEADEDDDDDDDDEEEDDNGSESGNNGNNGNGGTLPTDTDGAVSYTHLTLPTSNSV